MRTLKRSQNSRNIPHRRGPRSESLLRMDDDGDERGIDLEAAVVFDEAQLLELVHEEVHAGTCRPDVLSDTAFAVTRRIG